MQQCASVSLFLLAFVLLFAVTSCQESYNTYENSLHIRPSSLAEIDTPNYTSILWLDSVQSVGTLTQGDSIKINFHFQNTGKKALFILNAQPSCGCTDVEYPQNIILPGEKGQLTATFSTLAQPLGQVVKSIVVKTNTSNSMRHALLFKGEIIKKTS